MQRLWTKAYAASTQANFHNVWCQFIQFIKDNDLQLFPPCEDHIAMFLVRCCNKGNCFATINNTLSSIKTFYNAYGYVVNSADMSIRLSMQALKRTVSAPSHQRLPLEPAHLQYFISVTDFSDPLQVLTINAICLGFFAALRISNIVPPSPAKYIPANHLSRADVVFDKQGLIVCLKWTKTIQNSDQVATVPIAAPPPGAAIDPVTMFSCFAQRFPVHPIDPCFSYYRNGRLYVLTQAYLNKAIKDLIQKMGLSPRLYSGHSLRRGAASAAASAGISSDLLRAHGTWRSSAYTRYVDFTYQDRLAVTRAMYSKFQ